MEESDDSVSSGRRTRSAAKVIKPAIPKSQRPKPLSKKTRKKVVLMEVEVSDDEEEEAGPEEAEKVESTESAEQKTESPVKSKKAEELKTEGEKVDLNGSDSSNETKVIEESDNVVINDISMFQEEKISTNTEKTEQKIELDEKLTLQETIEEQVKSTIPNDSNKTESLECEEPQKKKIKIDSVIEIIPSKSTELFEKKTEVIEEKVEKSEDGQKTILTTENFEEKIIEVKSSGENVEIKGELKPEKEENTITKSEDTQVKHEEEETVTNSLVSEDTLKEKIDIGREESNDTIEKPEENVETEINSEKTTEKINTSSPDKQKADPDAENISEDELPVVQAVKVPEAEEVSDEELPGPKRAELPADTEVVSEDELPTVKSEVKKETSKRKLNETDYDPGSPTSESEAPPKKPSLDTSTEKEKDEKPKPKKLPELDKYWKAVNDDPTDFTGWTYLLQYVDQENDMEAAREAYDAFLSHYPYCYGYWRKYADYEKRKGNKKNVKSFFYQLMCINCLNYQYLIIKNRKVFERGLKAIPLSVDLWIHYLTYVKATRAEDEDFIRSQFERALTACGLEFRSDRLWDSYIKWETEGKRLQKVTAIYDRLLATPTQGYTTHFDNFQEHISTNPPNKVIEVDEFLALRKEVRQILKHDVTDAPPADSEAPPGDEDQSKVISSDEETKSIRERIVSIRRKVHKSTVNAVTARWNYEEGIKRPYFHVKPLERCQLKNWQDYLDYETEQGDRVRIIVLFERCLIACALYEEFWLKFVHFLENLKDSELQSKIRDVYERACTIHHLKKPNLHLQWAMFEESVKNFTRAAEILVNLEKCVPNILQIAYRRINLERRRGDHEKCCQLYEHYINNSKNKMISSSISIKYSRFCYMIIKELTKAQEILKSAISKDPNNPRLYLQLIDLTLQKEGVTEKEILDVIDLFLNKESPDTEQKILFSQRKLEYLEDFGSDVQSVQLANEQYQKLLKLNKDLIKKKEAKSSDAAATTSKSKEKATTPSSSQSYGNYGQYGNSAQPSYPYSGSQQGPNYYPQYGQGDQYQYQNWQYPQGSYGGYNQWGGYSGGYGY